jgi:hypothetical protein
MNNRLVDPNTKDDPVWRHSMEFHTDCTKIHRDIGKLWRATFVLLMCKQLCIGRIKRLSTLAEESW